MDEGHDALGEIVEKYEYEPYGQTYILTAAGSPLTASDYGNPLMWTGQRYDAAVGLHHFRHRAYSPALGRWLQRDPIGYAGGSVSLYEYVGSSAIGAFDPLGLAFDTTSPPGGGNGDGSPGSPPGSPPGNDDGNPDPDPNNGGTGGKSGGKKGGTKSDEDTRRAIATTLEEILALAAKLREKGLSEAEIREIMDKLSRLLSLLKDLAKMLDLNDSDQMHLFITIGRVEERIVRAFANHRINKVGQFIAREVTLLVAGIVLGELLRPLLLADDAGRLIGRALDDILADAKIFRGFIGHKFPSGRPFPKDQATKIWLRMKESGLKPVLDPGHAGSKWPGPHINVRGRNIHIPVDPKFKPPPP